MGNWANIPYEWSDNPTYNCQGPILHHLNETTALERVHSTNSVKSSSCTKHVAESETAMCAHVYTQNSTKKKKISI